MKNEPFDPRVTGNYSRSPVVRTTLRVGLITLLLSSGATMACSSLPVCNLHIENGQVILDTCAGQDQKPPKDGSDEKPAFNDPEKPTG